MGDSPRDDFLLRMLWVARQRVPAKMTGVLFHVAMTAGHANDPELHWETAYSLAEKMAEKSRTVKTWLLALKRRELVRGDDSRKVTRYVLDYRTVEDSTVGPPSVEGTTPSVEGTTPSVEGTTPLQNHLHNELHHHHPQADAGTKNGAGTDDDGLVMGEFESSDAAVAAFIAKHNIPEDEHVAQDHRLRGLADYLRNTQTTVTDAAMSKTLRKWRAPQGKGRKMTRGEILDVVGLTTPASASSHPALRAEREAKR